MDLVELEFLELQTPLFLNGVNFGTKFPGTKHAPGQIDLFLDEAKNRVLIRFKDKVALIPLPNVVTKTPKDCQPYLQAIHSAKKPQLTEMQAAPAQPRGPGRPKVSAQVSTPTSHVFAPKVG